MFNFTDPNYDFFFRKKAFEQYFFFFKYAGISAVEVNSEPWKLLFNWYENIIKLLPNDSNWIFNYILTMLAIINKISSYNQ